MTYAVVIYPNLEDVKIQKLRKKYDPYFNLIKPHITLVFPFSDNVSKEELISHIEKSIKNFKAFDIDLEGLEKSFDNWLFLLIGSGNNIIIELHDMLYSGMLDKYLRKDIRYIPHIGLGLFKNDKDYKNAESEAKKLKLKYKCKIISIYLINLKDNYSKINWSKEFPLS